MPNLYKYIKFSLLLLSLVTFQYLFTITHVQYYPIIKLCQYLGIFSSFVSDDHLHSLLRGAVQKEVVTLPLEKRLLSPPHYFLIPEQFFEEESISLTVNITHVVCAS